MYANFKLKKLKYLVWGAASAYILPDFENYMKKLKDLNVDAFNWLSNINHTLWSRAHFSSKSKSDMLCNNISESFNQYIKEAWD